MKFWQIALSWVITGMLLNADDLQKARFTEVIRDVTVTKPDNSATRPASVNGIFEVPEVIRTGMDSRAELEAPDKTIARIGANTIFSFEAAKRTMNLQSGSVLFHSPKGMGGGTIKTAAATAAVTGTTILVGATSNGGFKLMVLEGTSRVTHPSGDSKLLNAGQMTFLVPGKNVLGPTISFDLKRATQNSSLLHGFDKEISSKEKISGAIDKQQIAIKQGKLGETQKEIGDVGPLGPKLLGQDDKPRPPKLEDVTGQGPGNSFFQLANYLNSHDQLTLNLSSPNLNGVDVFFSNISAKGNYNNPSGFSAAIDTKTSYAAVAAKSIAFNNQDYNLTGFGNSQQFVFAALGGGISLPSGIPTRTLTFSADTITFDALNNISNGSGSDLRFLNTSGAFKLISMTSKNGIIDLNNPTFNSTLTTLNADTIIINSLNMAQFTSGGPKALKAFTSSGHWFYSDSTFTANTGALNIQGSATGTTSFTNNLGPGQSSQVIVGGTPFEIYSFKK